MNWAAAGLEVGFAVIWCKNTQTQTHILKVLQSSQVNAKAAKAKHMRLPLSTTRVPLFPLSLLVNQVNPKRLPFKWT